MALALPSSWGWSWRTKTGIALLIATFLVYTLCSVNIGLFKVPSTLFATFNYQENHFPKPIKSNRNEDIRMDMTSDPSIKERFLQRDRYARDICSKQSADAFSKSQGKGNRLGKFADSHYRWCRVPKVGTSFLSFVVDRVIKKNKNSENYKRVKKDELKSFFVVREPYSRLVSGYIGKIVTNQPWWTSIGTYIIKHFRTNATSKEKSCGSDVTFPEFVKYFIHSQETGFMRNDHWKPMFELCNPCVKSYDYIVHLETLTDDLKYMLRLVNISIDLAFSDEETTMHGKSMAIVKQKKKIVKCENMCSALRKVWWSYQARGLVSTEFKFPVKENMCESISGERFSELTWKAHLDSVGLINKSKQKRQAKTDLFLQVPLEDRIKVRNLLSLDFQLFGYDPQPDYLFPELASN